MRVGAKIAVACISFTIVTVLLISLVLFYKIRSVSEVISSGVKSLGENQVAGQIAKDVYVMCQTQHDALLKRLDGNLNVARHLLRTSGKVSVSEGKDNKIEWQAINQFTKEIDKVTLPKLMIGKKWLGKNSDFALASPLVDEHQKLVGDTCTIFQRINEKGDMLRVVTNVKTTDGKRAIGTYIPRVNPDGNENPVISTILSRKTYVGRAFVVNAWYITVYEPILDSRNQVVGALYVGIKQENVASIRRGIMETRVGKTGYVSIWGGSGDQKGVCIISKNGEADGKNFWDAKDAQGNLFVQAFIKKALGTTKGNFFIEKYPWRNPGEKSPQLKVAAVTYFEPWDWVISAETFEEDFADSGKKVAETVLHLLWWILGVAGVAIFLSLILSQFFSRTITGPLKKAGDLATAVASGNLTHRLEIKRRDEIGELAQALNHMADNLGENEKTLKKLIAQNEMILNAAGEGIIGLDQQGIITFANPAAARLTGFEINELIGKNGHDYLHHSKPDGTTYSRKDCPMYHTLASGEASTVLDEVFWRRDGTNFEVTYLSTPIIESDKILGAVVTFWDISERKKTEAALRESELAREKEHQKTANLESLSYLAGGIAHDFNNLLTAILGNLSLGLVQADEENPLYSTLQQAEQATLKARGLAQQLLTFAKGGVPDKKHIALPNLIEQAAGFASIGSAARCEFSFPDHLWIIEADPDQITQVIQNLVINAVQAKPEGGIIKLGAVNITLTADCEFPLSGGRYVKIYVQDQGIGIAPENRDNIFHPYFTTKKGGTGLGLTSAYSIIKKHGGYISFESEEGVGTCFYVYLPASEKESVPLQPVVKDIQKGTGRLLIMDDEPIVRDIFYEMAKHLGYEVECAKDGTEALELYRKAKESNQAFDLVIMDLTIPGGMGGKETIQKLLKIDSQAKVIVSSGYSDDPIIAHYKEYGFSGAIKKPYRIVTLSKVLSKCLKRLGND